MWRLQLLPAPPAVPPPLLLLLLQCRERGSSSSSSDGDRPAKRSDILLFHLTTRATSATDTSNLVVAAVLRTICDGSGGGIEGDCCTNTSALCFATSFGVTFWCSLNYSLHFPPLQQQTVRNACDQILCFNSSCCPLTTLNLSLSLTTSESVVRHTLLTTAVARLVLCCLVCLNLPSTLQHIWPAFVCDVRLSCLISTFTTVSFCQFCFQCCFCSLQHLLHTHT